MGSFFSMGVRKGRKRASRRWKGMQDLPDECLALVLSFLKSKADRDAAALTCRRWRSLERLSRHSLRFLGWHPPLDQRPHLHLSLLQALDCFPNILSLTFCSSAVHYSFSRVFQHKGFAQLTTLDLRISLVIMNDHLLLCLAAGCPSLIHLSLCASSITDTGMQSLAHGCPHLRFLDMSCCCISDKGMDMVLTKCTDLREFLVRETDVEGWGLRHGKLLRRLELVDCDVSDARGPSLFRTLRLPHAQGEATLASIGEYCKELEVLNLRYSMSLNDAILEKIARGCQNLRDLDLSRCINVSLDGWEALAFSCEKLEVLSVVGCESFKDDECLLPIVQEGCPNLRVLEVSDEFAAHPSMKNFRLARPAVAVRFYDEGNFGGDPDTF